MAQTNNSLYAIPATYLIALAPHGLSLVYYSLNWSQWPNDNARAKITSLESHPKTKTLPKEVVQRFQQIRAAHANGLETFPLFAIALLAGNYAKLPVDQLNSAAVQITVGRIIFNLLFILGGRNQLIAALRTLTWGHGIVAALRLLAAAAKSIAAQ